MLIVAGSLFVAEEERERYLEAVAAVTAEAREAAGCLDFVQSPDPLDPTRIVIFERWESAADLEAYRASGDEEGEDTSEEYDGAAGGEETFEMPAVTGAEVYRYEVASISAP